MLGFSLQKLLVLAAILGAIWYAFKFIGRLDQRRKRALKTRRQSANGNGANVETAGSETAGGVARAEEMVPCPVCQVYVAAGGAGNCGREDCPY